MQRMIKGIIAILFLIAAASFSYCEEISIEDLVSQYRHATDIQKAQLADHFRYSKMYASGAVQNVESWNAFDENKVKSVYYYRVTTMPQTAEDGTQYEINVLFKDEDQAKLIDKGQEIHVEGTFLKIIDERLIVSVWILSGEMTDLDKEMLK